MQTLWKLELQHSIIYIYNTINNRCHVFLSSVMHNTTLGSWIEWYWYSSEIHRGDKKWNFNDDTWIERKAFNLRAWSMLLVCDKLWSSKSKRYQIECHESSYGARLHSQRCNPYIFMVNILLKLKIRELAQSHIAECNLAMELRYWICQPSNFIRVPTPSYTRRFMYDGSLTSGHLSVSSRGSNRMAYSTFYIKIRHDISWIRYSLSIYKWIYFTNVTPIYLSPTSAYMNAKLVRHS